MVFAAGLGSRMRPLTDDRPKALIPVAGRPLIEHALEQVTGCAPIVVNAHHHAAALVDRLAGRTDLNVRVEETRLETGGGLRAALPLLGSEPVLTINADAVWTGPGIRTTLEAAWDGIRMDGLLLLVQRERVAGETRGSFAMAPDGRLSWDTDALVHSGAGIVRTDGLADFPEGPFSLLDLWLRMLAAGRLYGVIHPGRWADVGTPEGIARAETMLAAPA